MKKEGYQTLTYQKIKVVSGWIFGNLIFGGLIGIGIDLATHNQGHYPDDPIYATLSKKH